MKGIRILIAILAAWTTATTPRRGYAQERTDVYRCRIVVSDARTGLPLGFAAVMLDGGKKPEAGMCNQGGVFVFDRVAAGDYRLRVSFIGYRADTSRIAVRKDTECRIALQPEATRMDEVIVTASESKGMTSSSKIDRKAMEHLQPSSFTDLTELLPGGRSNDPRMGSANLLRLREANPLRANSDSDHDISSLGTSFLVDGVPILTGANMQYMAGASSDGRNTTAKGVDMRSIPTDDIEHVEIVRGIPSVEYGDLTSGLVKIERRKGGNRIDARFKADAQSKLVYIGKGFEFEDRHLTLNMGLDFLDSKIDPRNNLENYKRLTGSLRLSKSWIHDAGKLTFDSNLDYGGSFDNEKLDPDINFHKEDRYESSYNRMAWANNLTWKARGESVLRSLSLATSVSMQRDRIDEVKYVQLNRDMPTPNSTTEGEHDGVYLPYQYVASLTVDGRPINAFAKLTAVLQADAGKMQNEIRIGGDWKMEKNLGRGQIYDPLRPAYPSLTTRPRPYNDIPAGHDLAFFAEDRTSVPFGNHRLEVQAGLRTTTMLNLSRRYALRGKFFFDPRVNVRWTFPTLTLAGRPLSFEVGGGAGWHTKTPTLTHLYPDLLYYDLPQLNYYHNDPAFRRLNLKTYVWDRTNYDLSAARNFKWEIRTDISMNGNRLSVDYFREDMSSGFRSGTQYKILTYKKYDASGLDPDALTAPPAVEELPYTMDSIHCLYGMTTNGSRLIKEGVEFQFASRRIPSIRTRLTINGAWFRTTYSNSQTFYQKPSQIIGGRTVPYIGLYDDPDGYVMQTFNTNFIVDTDIPRLKLGFSASVQCLWFSTSRTERKSGVPIAYIDLQGVMHPYTAESQQDMYLQWLTTNYREELYDKRIQEPFNLNLNLKVTKKLYKDRIALALFVNKILSYHPDYRQNGVTVRQVGRPPYFGMELDFKL